MKLKSWFILSVVILVNLNGLGAEAKVTVEEKKKGVDYLAYTEMYVQNIDLREMTFEIYDDDLRAFEEARLDDKKLNDLALELYEHFAINLKDVIAVNENQEIDPEKKALILNIKLSGRFRSEDMGLINWVITKSKAAETTLHLECQILDAQTKEVLAVTTDEHVITSPDHEQPLSSPQEAEVLSEIFRVWSVRFARVVDDLRHPKPAAE